MPAIEIAADLTRVLDLLPDPVLIHVDDVWVYANPPSAKLFGVAETSELIGRPIFASVPDHIRPEIARRARETAEGTPQIGLETPFHRYDGGQLDVSVTANPIAVNGARGVIVVFRDITDRIRSERRFRKLVEKAFDIIELLDQSATIKYISHPNESLLGYRTEDLIGQSMLALVHPDDLPRVVSSLQDMLEEPGRSRHAKLRMRAANGKWRIIEGFAVNMLADPDVAAIVLNARDVTDSEELARNLDRMHRIESLGSVASKVSHEINNLLMSMSPWADVLKRRYAAEAPLQKAATAIADAVNNGRRLTEEIRQFGKPAEINRRAVNIGPWLAELSTTLRAVLPESIRLETRAADATDFVPMDADQIRQALLNLVINARDAMPDGGRIDVEVRVNGALQLLVTDNGPGIPGDMLERIFEPFFTTKKHGTGLGLAVCQQIVARHGGVLRVDSQLGAGTTFTIELPI